MMPLGLALLLVALVAGESVGATRWHAGNLSPLIVGWQQFFRVQWTVAKGGGERSVEGYLTNVWGFAATDIQLLVHGYDGAGRRVGQLVAWGPPVIRPGGRVYFTVPVPKAATYDVAILAWNWQQEGGPRQRRH